MSQSGQITNGGGGGAAVEFLVGDSGGPVGPNAFSEINVLGGSGIQVVGNPGTNTLTINFTGGGVSWTNISANQTLAVNSGYFCSGGGDLLLALPTLSAVGDVIEVSLDGSTSFTITQAAMQQIRIGGIATTAGVGGSLGSTIQGDSVRIVCQTANLEWVVVSSMGNLTTI